MSDGTPTPLAEEFHVDLWRYGMCAGMTGCGWSQRGIDPATYEHHPSLGAARVRAAREAKAEVGRGN